MKWIRKSFRLEEAARQSGIEEEIILEFIQNQWIVPVEPITPSLDEEDIARLKLIAYLREQFRVNDEAVPIILHLVDQLNQLHYQIRRND